MTIVGEMILNFQYKFNVKRISEGGVGLVNVLLLGVAGCGPTALAIVDALSEGKLVVTLMGPGHFTTGGHFIVLRGVTAEGKLLVADPVSYNKSQQEWDAEIVFNEASRNNAANGPFWIIG